MKKAAANKINDTIIQALNYYEHDNFKESLDLANRVLKINENNKDALLIAARSLERLGHYQISVNIYDKVLQLDKNNIDAHRGIAEVFFKLRNYDLVEQALLYAYKIDNTHFDVLYGLGAIYKIKQRHESAVVFLGKAHSVNPDNLKVLEELCEVVYTVDSPEAAVPFYEKIYALTKKAGYLITMKTLVPHFFESNAEIDAWREQYKKNLLELLDQDLLIEKPLKELKQSFFQTIYQKRNNKELSILFARLVRKTCPVLNYKAPHIENYSYKENEKIKLGFIFSFNPAHVIADAFFLLFEKLYDDKKFDVHIFSVSQIAGAGDLWEKYQKKGRAINLPFDIEKSQKVIADCKIDILVHPELGINNHSYCLAFARLAPVQCSFTGIPITSGIDTVDYYISEKILENDDVQDYFSEKVILMNNRSYLPTMKANLPKLKTKAELGFPTDKIIYSSPLKLQKFHPDFDRVIKKILEKDKNGLFMIFKDKQIFTLRLEARLKRNLGDELFKRIMFIPEVRREDFPDYLNVPDCLLDCFYYGFGTTAFIAFNYGLPVATIKKGYLVGGRVAGAFYEQAGIPELVAENEEDFVDLCIKLGNDKAFYEYSKQKILEKKHILTESKGTLDEMLEIFETLVKK